MTPNRIVASLLFALSAQCAVAGTPLADVNELHQRQFRYARAMMQLNQIEGFERGPSIDALLRQEREAKAKRAEERWRDSADVRAQSMDEFAKAVEHVATSQRAKRTMSRQWQIDENYPAHWSVSGNEAAAADCARAIEHPLGQPLRIEMNRDGVAWLRVVAPGKGYWAFDTLVSEFDTKLSVYRDCRDIGSEAKQMSDDTVGLGSIVGLDAKTAGQIFLIKLERKGGVGSLAIAKSVLAQSISGTVRRAADNATVRYGYVAALRPGGGGYSDVYITPYNNGEYVVTLYGAGDYYVRATELVSYYGASSDTPGSIPEIYPGAGCASVSNTSHTFCSGTKSIISVDEGQSVSGIDFMLDQASILTGVVTDVSNGEPVVDARVRVFVSDDIGETETQRTVETDDFGRFRLTSLPSRTWLAEFSHARYSRERWDGVHCSDYACTPGSGNAFTTTTANVTILEPDLTPRNYLRFRVMVGSIPAESATVKLFNQNGAHVANGSTDWGTLERGFIDVGPLAAGTYRAAVFSNAGFTQMVGGPQCAEECNSERFSGTLIEVPASAGHIDVDLQQKPSLTVQVVQQGGGAPIANAEVRLMGYGFWASHGSTDGEGQIRLASIGTGTYVVHVVADGFVDELFDNIACEDEDPLFNCPAAMPMVFSNTSPLEQTISVALSPSATMTGRIGSRTHPEQGGINYATLYRLDSDGSPLSSHSVYPNAGDYSVLDVINGSFRWGVEASGYFLQIFDGVDCNLSTQSSHITNCPYANGTLVANADGVVRSDVNFALMPRYTRVVRVLDAINNSPLQGIIIDQWSANQNWQASYVTGADGRAHVRILGDSVNSIYASYLSTDNFSEYLNEVYDNIACLGGASAYLGNCSMQQAALVPISDTNSTYFAPLEIKLLRDLVFRGNFDE